MKTRLAVLASAALLGALAGASGCTENRASVQTQMICAPTTTCVFSATCDAQYIGYPTVDKAVNGGYLWLFLQVGNNMPNNGDAALGRANTNDAHIDETSIEYEGALGGTQTIGSNQLVPADGSAVISVRLNLSAATGGAGATTSEVVAHVRLRGYLDDGTRFEAGDFPITVLVCSSGCVGAPADYGCDPTKPVCPDTGQLPFACTTL